MSIIPFSANLMLSRQGAIMQMANKFVVAAAALLIIVLFSKDATAEKKIGILLWNKETRYFEAQKGVMDQLEKDGFGGQKAKYIIENANGSKARIVELANEFAKAKMDMIITIGTSATAPAAKTIKDVPLVFSMVYDPVSTGIAKNWKSSGNNTTGASTWVPASKIISNLIEVKPVQRLAVIYTPGEKNSEVQLRELQKIQAAFNIKVIPVILASKEEAGRILSGIAKTLDAIYLTGSSVVGTTVPIIVAAANAEKIVTITHLDDLVEKGSLFGVTSNSYHVGRSAGKKAAKVLNGTKPSSIPIGVEKNFEILLNIKTAKAGQFHIPPAFMKKVTKIIE